MKKTTYFFLAGFLTFLSVGTASAQSVVGADLVDVVATPQFFISLLAGVLLAIGFQVLLTSLSVAIGISAIGNIEKKNSHHSKDHSDDSNSSGNIGVKISSAMGVYTLLTTSIVLFFASLLAVKLSLVANVMIAITLGLVIWAAFFSLMAYLEVKAVSSTIGGIINMAVAGIRTSTSAIQSIFERSTLSKTEKVAENTIEKIRAELSNTFDTRAITRKMDEYVERLQPNEIDYEKIKNELADLIRDIQLEEKTQVEGDVLERKTFVQLASEQPNLSKQDIKRLARAFDEAKNIVQSEGTKEDKLKKAVSQFTPAKEEDVEEFVQKIENYLRNTRKEELNPELIRNDLEKIVADPIHARSILSERFKKMDRSTVVALLAQNKNIGEQRAEKIADYVEQAIDFVSKKVSKQQNQTQDTGYNQETTTTYDLQNSAYGQKEESKGTVAKLSEKANEKIKNYLNSLERPELSYDNLKWDIEQVMKDPKASFSVLRHRLQQFDKETLVALLASNDKISRQDAENFVAKVEETKDRVLSEIERLEMEAERKIEQLKQEALHQAENTRKTAASAAWWLFATAVVSGAAAALGGWVALL